ncbi:MAG: HNH endonuclease [Alphaproteobacteria bacterium]|nr:HNH endonuclease [Alphaproteobacteria bacterium]
MTPKEITSLLASLEKNSGQLTKKHLKKIYALLIASGQFPVCPWCLEYIYNINDFTWDHIVPKSCGGTDDLSNLQPMHKSCNNEMKQHFVYTTEYKYDICEALEQDIKKERASSCKKQVDETNKKHTKERYKNTKRGKCR